MPELPEVETIARTLTPLIAGREVVDVDVRWPKSLDAGSLDLALLRGRRFCTAARRGKLALLCLEPSSLTPLALPAAVSTGACPPASGRAALCAVAESTEAHMLAVHLKMTGRLFVYGPEVQPSAHTRAVFTFKDAEGNISRLFFDDARTFGYLRLVSPASLPAWPFWNALGLEPLEHRAEDLAAVIGPRQSSIKALLLDQKLVAGIGNIYADEALFRAGLDPRRKAHTIPLALLVRLFTAVREVLQLSIEQCGSSIRDYRDARGDAGAFQNTFKVYGRKGQRCFDCGSALESATVAGRATVFCPHCQK